MRSWHHGVFEASTDLWLGHEVELHVSNLGRLKEARLDIRPLTVFIGPNHTNKTWTAYSLYGIARNLARIEFATNRTLGFAPNATLQNKVEGAADRLLRTLTETPASEVRARISRDEVIQGVPPSDLTLSLDAEGLSAVLNIAELLPTRTKADLIIGQDEFEHSVYSALEVTYKSDLELECRFTNEDGSAQRHPYTVRLSLAGGRGPNHTATDTKTDLKGHLEQAVHILAYTLLDHAAVLPSERKSLLSLDLLNLDYRRTSLEEPVFAAPVYDFLYMIGAARRLRDVPGSRPEFPLRLAEVLEKQIIQGTVNFEEDDQSESKKPPGAMAARKPRQGVGARGSLRYSTDEGVELAMHASASIVRAMAGLGVYLKEFCDRGGLLVIDEPEMNAHPEAQLKIIEFLASMAHHGVRVVMTTHSPYIVDHLSNLMQASQLREEAKRAIAPQFKLGMQEAFLPPEDVSVYLFNESGVVEDILDREQGIIDLTNFSRPTEYMANLVNAIWKAADEDVCKTVEQRDVIRINDSMVWIDDEDVCETVEQRDAV